ncbi:MAG: FtsX-like permease family protein [Acidobacteria bacterium]|nr:MAG: FtsX-like permease family protein [Acidobacteriota bacterium]
MNLPSILKVAFRELARNKARSMLTMLGIIIGVASVIAMVGLGQGAQRQVEEEIASMGTNMLVVFAGSRKTRGWHGGIGTSPTLTPEDIDAIVRECPAVALASPNVTAPVSLIFGNQNWTTRAEGVNDKYPQIRNWPVASGQFFTEGDVHTAARVCVIGQTVAEQLFPGLDPVGQTLRVRNLPFRVVGVLSERGQNQWGRDQDDVIMIPYTTAMKKLLSITYIPRAYISAISPRATFIAERQITELLRQRHHIRPGQEDDFGVHNLTDIAEAAEETNRILTLLLSSIAGVSLIVGGIGIMNIMLVSVTERTREIGIRMAVGARTRHVRLQFLIESVVLSLIGGLLGIFLGIGVSFALSGMFNWPRLISPLAIAMSVAFSVAVGVLFGYYPAHKAASLDPIDALRYE